MTCTYLVLSLEELKGRPLFMYKEGWNGKAIPNVIPEFGNNNKTGGMKFEVTQEKDTDKLVCHILTSQKEESIIEFYSNLLQFAFSLWQSLVVLGKLHVFAEHT